MPTAFALLRDELDEAQFLRIFAQPDFKEAVRHIAQIDSRALEKLVDKLQTAEGFLGLARLRDTVSSVVPDEEQRGAALSAILNFSSLRARAAPDLDFDAEVERIVRDRFSGETAILSLLGPFAAVEMARKAEGVADLLGADLDSVQFVTDARPVFDDSREKLLGCVPLTTMKLQVSSVEDHLPRTIEVKLTERQLIDLGESAARGLTKLLSLKRQLAEKGIAIPATRWTEDQT